jgi:hypothetical protein
LDWKRYKQICDTPNVFSRWMLQQTIELTEPSLAAQIDAVFATVPVAQPADHSGGEVVDMFELAFTQDQVDAICLAVLTAASAGQTTSGTRDRGLGGFVEAWSEYSEHLSRSEQASCFKNY